MKAVTVASIGATSDSRYQQFTLRPEEKNL
jgi:hypothetical protein